MKLLLFWRYLWPYPKATSKDHNQDREHVKKLPSVHLQSTPSSSSGSNNHWLTFCHYKLMVALTVKHLPANTGDIGLISGLGRSPGRGTVVLEKTLESPLDCKETKPVNPKGNQPWIFFARTDAEAPILWPPDAKNWLNGKDPDARKDWRQEEKGTKEDEMVGWHHQLDGHEFEQTLGDSKGQRNLLCPWGHKESHTTERLNWTEVHLIW